MGFPRFYWYPKESGIAYYAAHGDPLLKVDIDEPISDLQYSMKRTVTDSIAMSGKKFRAYQKPYVEVRIILERFTDEALARDLYSMEAHLQKGGAVGFSMDRDKTWLSFVGDILETDHTTTTALASQSSRVHFNAEPLSGPAKRANFFAHWESAATIAVGDVVHLDGTVQRFNHEELKVGSLFPDGADKTRGWMEPTGALNRYEYGLGSVIRFRDFWPFLCLPESQVGRPLITHDHRINFTFDATFHYYPGWTGLIRRTYQPPEVRQSTPPYDISDPREKIGSIEDKLGQGFRIADYIGIGDSLADSLKFRKF